MKPLSHYIYWLKRDAVHRVLRCKPLSLFISRNCLKQYLSLFYFNWTGKKINWEQPQDFNEWLLKTSLKNSKSDKRMEIARCADKYAVRDYVEEKGYGHTLNELIGVYDNVDDIDWNSLPEKFVMKMNNASGRNLICSDKSKINWAKEKEQFRIWLKDRSFGLLTGEWQYSLIEPKIVIEKYLENLGEESLIDYKFNCINGKVYSCFVGYNRNPLDPHNEVCFDDYDLDWNRTDYIKDNWHKNRREIPKPTSFEEMKEMAENLCHGFDYCRFDLYEIDNRILFGEMTFTPQGCVLEFYNDSYLKNALVFASQSEN